MKRTWVSALIVSGLQLGFVAMTAGCNGDDDNGDNDDKVNAVVTAAGDTEAGDTEAGDTDDSGASSNDAEADVDKGERDAQRQTDDESSADSDKDDGAADPDLSEAEPTAVKLAGSKLGFAAAFVDYDGDETRDAIAGAPHAPASGDDQLGAALVYDGVAVDKAANILRGEREFGYAVANLGDVDGDGRADFAIGATHGSAGGVALSGSVQVLAGGSSGKTLARLGGESAPSKFGFAIAGGDFNGDGAADIAVGSPFHTPRPDYYQTGAVHVYFGPDLKKKQTLLPDDSHKGLGWALSAGDLNSDGMDELVVSAKASSRVMVYLGHEDFAPQIGAADYEFSSSDRGFGLAIAVVASGGEPVATGPVLAIGSPNAAVQALRDVGSVYMVQLLNPGTTVDVNAASAPAELLARIDGGALYAQLGAAIADAGDLDDDGISELLISAPRADDNNNDMVGKVYLFHGKDLSHAAHGIKVREYVGQSKYGMFGQALAVDGAGHALVGAARSDADLGAVHVLDLKAGAQVTFPVIAPADTALLADSEHDHI